MAAPKGNQFWKLRSKHGRDKIFETPELMWQSALEYFEWCDNNPFRESQIVKFKDSHELAEVPKMRPYTMQGLSLYFNCNVSYFKDFHLGLKGKKDKLSLDFYATTTRIREVIYNQKFSGAASGFLNPNIIARDLGLTDKKDVVSKVKISEYEDLTIEELREEIERLEQ